MDGSAGKHEPVTGTERVLAVADPEDDPTSNHPQTLVVIVGVRGVAPIARVAPAAYVEALPFELPAEGRLARVGVVPPRNPFELHRPLPNEPLGYRNPRAGNRYGGALPSHEPAVPTVLTIAGSDSGGGAGIQADLKTFHRFGVHGTTAVTLVTAQDTQGVRQLHVLPSSWVTEQIEAVVADLGCHAAKTGALGAVSTVEAVSRIVERMAIRPLVVDPVFATSSGTRLLDEEGIEMLRSRLIPCASLLTPNLPEAERLLGVSIRSEAEMRKAARALHALGAEAILITGGHLGSSEAVDFLFDGRDEVRLAGPWIVTRSTHGTGCTLSAAIAAGLARGEPLARAVRAAKEYVTRALAGAPDLGRGHGPLQ